MFAFLLNFLLISNIQAEPVCEMTVGALKLIEAVDSNNHKMFFHCTVGEDRTGYLAGLYKIYRDNKRVDEVFESELCDKG